jgi:hypothetical protein
MAEFVHNQWPSATTTKTPFELIMGYTPKTEWVMKPCAVPSVTARISEMKKLREEARQAMQKAQEVMKMGNSGNKKFRPYREEDQVWLEGTNLKTLYPSAKLGPKRYGPFKIMKQLSNAVYRLEIPRHWKIHNVFHANLLTPYKETELHGPNFTRPPPDLVDGEEEYEVEKILDARPQGRGRKMHYLVKWKGYPTSDNSWEPEENVHAEELIKEFHKRNPKHGNTKKRKL